MNTEIAIFLGVVVALFVVAGLGLRYLLKDDSTPETEESFRRFRQMAKSGQI